MFSLDDYAGWRIFKDCFVPRFLKGSTKIPFSAIITVSSLEEISMFSADLSRHICVNFVS